LARTAICRGRLAEIRDRPSERMEQAPTGKSSCDGAPLRLGSLESARDGRHARFVNPIEQLRDRRAWARYAGLTGAPDRERLNAAGKKRDSPELATPVSARRISCWRFLKKMFQKESSPRTWYRSRPRCPSRPRSRDRRKDAQADIELWRLDKPGETLLGQNATGLSRRDRQLLEPGTANGRWHR